MSIIPSRSRIGPPLVSLFLVLLVAFTACAPSAPAPAATAAPKAAATTGPQQAAPTAAAAAQAPVAPIKIGLILPMTGSYSVYGIDVLTGANFVVDQINKAGGIKGIGGAKIETILADDASDTKAAMTEFERLVSKEKVDFIIGPFPSNSIAALGPLADRYQINSISVGGQGDDVAKLNLAWSVHVGPMGPRLGEGIMNTLLDVVEEFKLPADRIVFFAGDSAATRWPIDGSKAVAKARGYESKFAGEVYAPTDSKDLTSSALKLKALKPDILVANNSQAFAPLMIRAMDAIDFAPPLWGDTLALFDPKTQAAVGDELFNKIVRRAGVFYYDYDHPDLPIKGVQNFKTDIAPYLKEKNLTYTTRMPNGAQAVYAIVRAINEAKTRDKAAINDALHKIKITTEDLDFVSGQFAPAIEFKPNGELKNFRTVGVQNQVVNGKTEKILLYPKEVRPAGAKPWIK